MSSIVWRVRLNLDVITLNVDCLYEGKEGAGEEGNRGGPNPLRSKEARLCQIGGGRVQVNVKLQTKHSKDKQN